MLQLKRGVIKEPVIRHPIGRLLLPRVARLTRTAHDAAVAEVGCTFSDDITRALGGGPGYTGAHFTTFARDLLAAQDATGVPAVALADLQSRIGQVPADCKHPDSVHDSGWP